ncbi:hypothetical protein [Agromyces lapidis]|uniref:Glucosamine kinase n=1 Tax=Agromyces lapidis TaxID=279574 RepID=A0ABV5SPA6_9MICO|nr:hypothetical protein [Agromyces lapidis]
MNSMLSGELLPIGGRTLAVDADGLVRLDGRRVAAGDGVARALAATVDATVSPETAAERAITVDQTNVSVIVDERIIVKLVANWGAAERSARLLERLDLAGVGGVERLRGTVRWRHPVHGTGVLAVVTDYLPGAEDGWTWAVDDAVAVTIGQRDDPEWPTTLGRRVAEIHEALAAEASPAPDGAPDARVRRAAATLAGAVDETGGAAGDRLRNRLPSLEAAVASLAASAPGLVFPIHGDLHLGQVLRSPGEHGETDDRYTVIDFDGDPQHDETERGRPDSAARDLAHLLVSVDLVAAVAQKRLGRADPASFAWADRARAALLAGYLDALRRPELFDATLLAGFEAEQLAAELRYAARFLPRWQYAPDAALTHRHPSTNDRQELPWTPPPSDPTSN